MKHHRKGKFVFPVALLADCGYKRASERSGRACRGRSLCLRWASSARLSN